ncbi:MAG: hypothetical protein U0X73_17430 [Thermoanaerobaculia bacterium]
MDNEDLKTAFSALALVVSTTALWLSFKTRREGMILKLIPKFSADVERADKEKFWNEFENKHGPVGFRVSLSITVQNPSPYLLEIEEISSDNYYFVKSFSNFSIQRDHRSVKPARDKSGQAYAVDPGKDKRLSFWMFVEAEMVAEADKRFPDINLAVRILQHSDPTTLKTYEVHRPVRTDNVFITKR